MAYLVRAMSVGMMGFVTWNFVWLSCRLRWHRSWLALPLWARQQVWSLSGFYLFLYHGKTQCASPFLDTNSIFSVSFCKKSLICLEGKSMTPCRGTTILFRSSQQLPRLRLGHLKGFLSWHGALQGPPLTSLVRCFQNYRETRTPSGVQDRCWSYPYTVKNN